MLERIRNCKRQSIEHMWFTVGTFTYGVVLAVLMLLATILDLTDISPAVRHLIHGIEAVLLGFGIFVLVAWKIIRSKKQEGAWSLGRNLTVVGVISLFLPMNHHELAGLLFVPGVGLIALHVALVRERVRKKAPVPASDSPDSLTVGGGEQHDQ